MNQQGHSNQYGEQRSRPFNQQAPRSRGVVTKQRQGADQGKADEKQASAEEKEVVDLDKQSKVNCFNYAEWGHYSSDCKQPRMCFICQTTSHVGRECPEWLQPMAAAQYLGSAAHGLGFFSILMWWRRRTKLDT
jgi:hypothetical protein